jgi:hypothetical protein
MPRTKKHERPDWVKRGALCFYQPIVLRGQRRFAGVIDTDPWQLGDGSWVVHVDQLEPAYGEFVGLKGRTRVCAAHMFSLSPRAVGEVAEDQE